DRGHDRIVLRLAQDVEREEDVVGDAGVDEDLDFTELLTGNADRARRHLHTPDRGNLVRLDVRPVGDAVPRQVGLHAGDVVAHDVEIDGDDGRVQVRDGGHEYSFLSGRKRRRE